MALFCIILTVISSVVEIKALGPHMKIRCKDCKPKRRQVSKSPRQKFHPKKVTVSYSPCYLTGTGQVLPSIFWIRGAG